MVFADEILFLYFRDFLKRCEEYGLHESNKETGVVRTSELQPNELQQLTNMARTRNAKMEQYRQKKELQEQIQKIKIVMEREHIDDGVKRDFYLKVLKSSIMESQEELTSIAQEKQILEYMAKRAQDGDGEEQMRQRKPVKPLKPIIITRDAAQKAVYGLGYPSLPTMSVADFYEERVRSGVFPDPSVVRDPNSLQARAMRGDTTELDEMEDIKKVS